MALKRFATLGMLALMATVSVKALAQDLEATSGETVYFRGWQYKTDIVQDNVDRYNSEQGGKVDYATVTGDYPALMEQNLIAGAELDVLYANPSQAGRYFDGGWITPAEDLPNIEAIKADMFPNILDAWTYKGKLMGLSYFVSTRGVMHVNLKAYEEAGLSDADFPKDWDALYEQLYVLRDAGIEQPFLPHWINEWYGISWAFVFEVLNRGGKVAEAETHAPLLTTAEDGPAYKTLAAWKQIWNDGIGVDIAALIVGQLYRRLCLRPLRLQPATAL
ncbi:MAG: extracellular solute-binding protein [Pseudomonadota bacterium]